MRARSLAVLAAMLAVSSRAAAAFVDGEAAGRAGTVRAGVLSAFEGGRQWARASGLR